MAQMLTAYKMCQEGFEEHHVEPFDMIRRRTVATEMARLGGSGSKMRLRLQQRAIRAANEGYNINST